MSLLRIHFKILPRAQVTDFLNNLLDYISFSIWPDGIVLNWVEGHDGDIQLVWSSKYLPSLPFFQMLLLEIHCRDVGVILTEGQTKVTAKTDGSLQIWIPDRNVWEGSFFWTREYYAIPLELPTTTSSQDQNSPFLINISPHSYFVHECSLSASCKYNSVVVACCLSVCLSVWELSISCLVNLFPLSPFPLFKSDFLQYYFCHLASFYFYWCIDAKTVIGKRIF